MAEDEQPKSEHGAAEPLTIWTVYASPADYPGRFVARRWLDDQPTDSVMLSKSLDSLRDQLCAMGLVAIARHESDPPIVVETWL